MQAMLLEYRRVTEQEKAEVVSLGGLHVVGTGVAGSIASGLCHSSCALTLHGVRTAEDDILAQAVFVSAVQTHTGSTICVVCWKL